MAEYNPQGWTHGVDGKPDTWSFFHAKLDAARLPLDELKQHAAVSLDNRHKCRSCFTCACVEVLQEKRSHDRR